MVVWILWDSFRKWGVIWTQNKIHTQIVVLAGVYMKTSRRQLLIQDHKYRHESQVPMETGKGMEVHTTWQKWRARRENWAWNLGNTWVWDRDKSGASNMGWGAVFSKEQKIISISTDKGLWKKYHVGSRLRRGHRIWCLEAVVYLHKKSFSRAGGVEVWLKCTKKWR